MNDLKIYVAANYSIEFGVECVMVIAESKDKALEMVNNKEGVDGFYREDDLREVPYQSGCTYIGGYAE